jgi:5-amino-6-(5-phospho-D-ribitylamino)uracil phosphatase
MLPILTIDLDGTLLCPKGTITEKNKTMIACAHAAGASIVIATGRMPLAVQPVLMQLAGLINTVICFNGALTLDVKERSWTRSIVIQGSGLTDFMGWIDRSGYVSVAFFGDDVYVRNSSSLRDPVLDYYARRTGATFQASVGEDYLQRDFHKILIYDPGICASYVPYELNPYEAELHERILPLVEQRYSATKTALGYIEVMSLTVSKREALERLDAYTTQHRPIVAFGDSYNDLEMFAGAQLSIAMSTGAPPALAAANLVCQNQQHEGVGIGIEYLIHNGWDLNVVARNCRASGTTRVPAS